MTEEKKLFFTFEENATSNYFIHAQNELYC